MSALWALLKRLLRQGWSLFWAPCLPQAIPAPEHPTAFLLLLPPPRSTCSNNPTSFPKSDQCHNTEHHKLTIHRERQSRSRFRLALKALGYIALGIIIIIFIRIKLALVNMFPLLFKCP